MNGVEPQVTGLVTAAEIARIAGVTRAAVANWRRRYADFPSPVGGTTASPLFDRAEVEQWLADQGKGRAVSMEVRLWERLRAHYGPDVLPALLAVGQHLLGEAADSLPDALRAAVDAGAAERGSRTLFADLIARYLASAGRGGVDTASSERLVRFVAHFAGSCEGLVYDPACGIGSLLGAVGGDAVTARFGQDSSAVLTEVARLRSRLGDLPAMEIACGDSIRDDRLPDLRADLVVCDPPTGQTDWGREELLLVARWDLPVPPRTESELAWLQVCFSRTRPGGRVVIVMPASVAYRRPGRRIRAELVRRGLLRGVVALPAGVMSSHALSVHLWIVQRPEEGESARGAAPVRMVDLSANSPEGPLEPTADQAVDIPAIDLLDEHVDFSPARWISTVQQDYAADYTRLRAELIERIGQLAPLLPPLPEGPGPRGVSGASVELNDLSRAGLIEAGPGGEPRSLSDQLDTDYLRGFLHSPGNVRRSTTSTGTFRLDTRGATVPQMTIEDQRAYGVVFRGLADFEQSLQELAKLGAQAARLAAEGLTTGALAPPGLGASGVGRDAEDGHS